MNPFVPLPFRVLPGLFGILLAGCINASSDPGTAQSMEVPDESKIPAGAEVATFGAGCFWCVEEVFHQTPGVLSAVSGYMGGTADDAKYKKVSAGLTDHAEVVQVHFDPGALSYDKLLDVFWKLHDPTQLNRQGPDWGRQYRSAIFYHSEEQAEIAKKSKQALADAKVHGRKPIVTEITKAMPFYDAEDYHQNFARLNPNHPYLRAHLYPKLKKLGMKIPK